MLGNVRIFKIKFSKEPFLHHFYSFWIFTTNFQLLPPSHLQLNCYHRRTGTNLSKVLENVLDYNGQLNEFKTISVNIETALPPAGHPLFHLPFPLLPFLLQPLPPSPRPHPKLLYLDNACSQIVQAVRPVDLGGQFIEPLLTLHRLGYREYATY